MRMTGLYTWPDLEKPAAHMWLESMAPIPSNETKEAPLKWGAATTTHFVPFQCSISGEVLFAAPRPTAHALVEDSSTTP